jgi:hypothetical protein
LDRVFLVYEANAPKWACLQRRKEHAELAQRSQSVRHDAFAASLIDWRLSAIGQRDGEAPLPRSNGCCQARRTSSRDEYFGVVKGIHQICS